MKVLQGRIQNRFASTGQRSDWRVRRAVQQHVEVDASEVRLLLELDQVAVNARQLQDGFQHILLRDPAGGVLRLRHVGELPQEIDAREMNIDRPAGDEEIGI